LQDRWKQFNEEKDKMAKLAEQQRGRVKLDIGGQTFHTSVTNLTKHKQSFFGLMFGGQFPLVKESDGSIFIDRSPKHFILILDFLRDDAVSLPTDPQLLEEIVREVNYYQLTPLMSLIENFIMQKGLNNIVTTPLVTHA